MLKQLVILMSLTLLRCTLAAYDLMVIPTLLVNVEDQVKFCAPDHGIFIQTVKQVEPGQPFHLKLALKLPEAAPQPLKISGTFSRRAPGGSEVEIFRDRALFDIPAGAKGIFFSATSISGLFAGNDAGGSYEWILQYSDGSRRDKTFATLKLVESIIDSKAVDMAEFNRIFSNYYRNARPEKLLAALDFFLTSGEAVMRQKKKDFDPRHIISGFVHAFKLNPQFHDELARATVNSPPKHHIYYALIFAGLGKEAVMAQKEVIEPLVQVQIGQFSGKNPLAFSEVKTPAHLDMLWMEFFITGKMEPIRRIAAELRKREGMTLQQAQEKIKSGGTLSEAEKKLLAEHLLQFAANWSLSSNLQQGHRLIGGYLQSIVRKKLIEDNGYIDGRIAAILIKANLSPRSKK